jgi:glutamyl-Q tRNA(Asp) synthetase
LQARSNGGQWLVRIEDLDPPREVPGAASAILQDLERLGFEWDGPVVYQSERTEFYEAALAKLSAKGVIYECSCSRKDATATAPGDASAVYAGTCRNGVRDPGKPTSLRVRTQPVNVEIEDRLQGAFTQQLERDVGDFVIRRRDGWFAYQLAVVVDDHLQGMSEIVRGCDLLDSTPRQWYLQSLLGLPHPDYVHLPVAVDAAGKKLSKQTADAPISQKSPARALYAALDFLEQQPPRALLSEQCVEPIWSWAVQNWRLEPLRGIRTRVWGEAAFACGCDGN